MGFSVTHGPLLRHANAPVFATGFSRHKCVLYHLSGFVSVILNCISLCLYLFCSRLLLSTPTSITFRPTFLLSFFCIMFWILSFIYRAKTAHIQLLTFSYIS